MSQKIYRQEALDRLSSPEQLDLLMPVTSPRGWLALLAVGLLLATGLAWSVFGTVATTVEGRGLLMRYGGFEWVSAPQAGTVTEILVAAEADVRAGDSLLRLRIDGDEAKTVELVSPRAGRVLNMAVFEGEAVAEGALLLSVESPEHPLQAVVYVPAGDGYRIAADMDAKILPATASRQGSTFLAGRVRSAARFPATQAEMLLRLQSEEWVGTMQTLGPALEVVIDVAPGSSLERIFSGTPCDATVTVERRRPIHFLIPVLGSGRIP